MTEHTDREQAQQVVRELRDSADRLIARSREMAEEAERLKRRADDLAQLIRQHDGRSSRAPEVRAAPTNLVEDQNHVDD